MKSIDLDSEALTLDQALRLARRENIVLRTAHGREFVLAELDDCDPELEIVRQNKSLLRLLARRSREKGKHTVNEARRLLGLPKAG